MSGSEMRELTARMTGSLRERGLGETLRAAAKRADHVLLTGIGVLRERRYDRRHGVDTAGLAEHPERLAHRPEFAHAVRYQGTPPRRFRRLIEALPIPREEYTFVDLGCGKGKSLLIAADLGFRRVIGVDFSPDLIAAAEANAATYRARAPQSPPIEAIHADAGAYPLPPEPTILYLFNPFDAVVLRRVVTNIERSLAEAPRPLYVVYLNAVHADVLATSTRLRPAAVPSDVLEARRERGLGRLRHERAGDLRAVAYASR
jgi:SAM-dependent methyltransferase